MRTGIISALIITVCLLIFTSCGSSKEFAHLDEYDNIDVVHIPQGVAWMLRSVASKSDDEAGKMVKGFRSLTVVDCEGTRGRVEVMRCVSNVLCKDKSELLLETHEGKESTYIYGRIERDNARIKNIMIVSDEPSDLSVVRAKGTFDLGTVIGSQMRRLP